MSFGIRGRLIRRFLFFSSILNCFNTQICILGRCYRRWSYGGKPFKFCLTCIYLFNQQLLSMDQLIPSIRTMRCPDYIVIYTVLTTPYSYTSPCMQIPPPSRVIDSPPWISRLEAGWIIPILNSNLITITAENKNPQNQNGRLQKNPRLQNERS